MKNEEIRYRLTELHLGRLSAEQARELERRIESDPQLAAESRAVARLLGLLDAYTVEVSADLTGRVVEAVDRRLQPVKITPESGGSGVGGGMLSVRDLIAAAAMLAVALALLIPAFVKARDNARLVACQDHLRNVGYGVMAYAASSNSNLPFAGHTAGASWLPTKTSAAANDNRRHLYLLMQQKFAEPRWFVCPSRRDAEPMSGERLAAFDTFPKPGNCSYSFQCMAGPRSRITEYLNMPIMADQTPLFRSGSYVRPLSELCNSLNHDARGQNVLYMDGRVKWALRPDVGVNGDNIWFVEDRGLDEYLGVEVPTSVTDAFLVH